MDNLSGNLTANKGTLTLREMPREDHAMARKRKSAGLTPQMIDALKRRGYNQTQIGEMYGLTRARVSQIKHEVTSFDRTPRERAMDLFPFRVPREPFQNSAPDKRLRDHAEYAVTGGTGMTVDKLKRLAWFYKKLQEEGLIVSFDVNNPPSEGIKYGGYKYEKRTDQDGDFIVRFNGDVDLSDEQKLMWRFPPVLPEL